MTAACMAPRTLLVALAMVIGVSADADAQTGAAEPPSHTVSQGLLPLRQSPRPAPQTSRPTPPPARESIGFRGYVLAGMATLAAQDTFDAVAGTRSRASFGGGMQVTNLWRRVFADVGASVVSLDGQRVFVDDGQVFELGIPLQVTMRSFDIAGGWRLALARGRVSPYVGAGLTYLSYEETSELAQPGDDVNEGKAGPLVLGGVDVHVWQWLHAGGELRYRRIGGILGEGGASAAFGEDDAGGVSVALRISVGR